MKTLNTEQRKELVEFLTRIKAEIDINKKTGVLKISYVNDELFEEDVELIRSTLTEKIGEDGFEIIHHTYIGEYAGQLKIDPTQNCEICYKRLKSCKGHKIGK